MAEVRRADRQVNISALQGGRKTAAATALSEGAGVEAAKGDKAQAMAAFGGEAARAGILMFTRIREEEKKKADMTAALEADNALSAWKADKLYNPETGAFTRKGKNAQGLPEELKADYDKVAGEIEAKLGNDDQKAAFQRARSQEWQSIDLTVRRHVFEQAQAYQAGELKSMIDNTTNAAIASANDPRLVGVEIEKAVGAIRAAGPGLGMGPEMIAEQERGIRTKAHVGVISNLLARDKDQEASAYYEAVKGQIAGEQVDGVEKMLEEGTLRGAAQKKADEIIQAGGTLAEQRRKAKDLEPKLRDQVEQRLEHEDAVSDRAMREAEQVDMRKGYDLLDQGRGIAGIPPALWTSYNGGTRSAMTEYARAKAKGTPIVTDDPSYYSLMREAGENPATFASKNLLEYRAKLDDGDFKQLVGIQLSIKNADGRAQAKELPEFQTRAQLLDSTLTLHGIDPNAKPDTAEGKAIAQLRRLVDRDVSLLQGGGNKASNQDIQASIDRILGQQVTVPGSWWNIFPGGQPFNDSTRRLIDTTIDQVPAADRAQIEAALRARKRVISDAVIVDEYIDHQRRGAAK